MYLREAQPDPADAVIRRMVEDDLRIDGYVGNATRLYSLASGAYERAQRLSRSIRRNIDERRYQLATMAAARALRSRYCLAAHGGYLMRFHGFDRERLESLVRDFRTAGLEPAEVAIMELAEKVALDAHSVTQDDIDALRHHGLDDAEIFGVVLAAAYRAFFSKVLDAVGCETDPELGATIGLLDIADGKASGSPVSSAALLDLDDWEPGC